MSRSRDVAACLLAAAALRAGAAAAQEAPDLSGHWKLDAKRSGDTRAQIEAVAGPDHTVRGASEAERLRLRRVMLATAADWNELEIRQTASEIKFLYGEAGARTFYLGREHLRDDGAGGQLRARTRIEKGQIVIEQVREKGQKDQIVEIFTPLPGGRQLLQGIRFESPLLSAPLEISRFYDRVGPSGDMP